MFEKQRLTKTGRSWMPYRRRRAFKIPGYMSWSCFVKIEIFWQIDAKGDLFSEKKRFTSKLTMSGKATIYQ